MRRWATTPKREQAGFNLIEVLIAMFIFALGILQILAIFPVAIYSTATVVNQSQGHILADTALALFTVDCQTPLAKGKVVAATTSSMDVAETIPAAAQFVTITSGKGCDGKVHRITSQTGVAPNVTLNVSPDWTTQPDATSVYRVTKMAWPQPAATPVLREGQVGAVVDAHTLRMAHTGGGSFTEWTGDQWTSAGSKLYFLILLKGKAQRKAYRVTGTVDDAAGDQIICADADFVKDGVAATDTFSIAGNDQAGVFPVTIPFLPGATPPDRFGTIAPSSAQPQTLGSPLVEDENPAIYTAAHKARYGERDADFPLPRGYSYTVIFSDQAGGGVTDNGVRADVLVYANFSDNQAPAKSRPAVAHVVRIERRTP